jgi:hypothetical protein
MALRSILLVSWGAFVAANTCPLSVEISNVDDHNVNVTITNQADKTVTFFKGNTVLDTRPVRKLLVQGEGWFKPWLTTLNLLTHTHN